MDADVYVAEYIIRGRSGESQVCCASWRSEPGHATHTRVRAPTSRAR